MAAAPSAAAAASKWSNQWALFNPCFDQRQLSSVGAAAAIKQNEHA